MEQIVDGHLKILEPRYCTFILNCPPNPQGLLDDTVVRTLREVGRRWRLDRTRPPLPPRPAVISELDCGSRTSRPRPL
ncbi:hypothetical protein [Thermomonospora amylolytica]|uniref:hypothetical protein n=1 Tax=Thermomonospora amylolytica TaxID=1411117 RepID=UPI000E6B6AC6|nr:hypothetical protein [Thermomonospora amylolytica]